MDYDAANNWVKTVPWSGIKTEQCKASAPVLFIMPLQTHRYPLGGNVFAHVQRTSDSVEIRLEEYETTTVVDGNPVVQIKRGTSLNLTQYSNLIIMQKYIGRDYERHMSELIENKQRSLDPRKNRDCGAGGGGGGTRGGCRDGGSRDRVASSTVAAASSMTPCRKKNEKHLKLKLFSETKHQQTQDTAASAAASAAAAADTTRGYEADTLSQRT